MILALIPQWLSRFQNEKEKEGGVQKIKLHYGKWSILACPKEGRIGNMI